MSGIVSHGSIGAGCWTVGCAPIGREKGWPLYPAVMNIVCVAGVVIDVIVGQSPWDDDGTVTGTDKTAGKFSSPPEVLVVKLLDSRAMPSLSS